jgi:hypothetical protein
LALEQPLRTTAVATTTDSPTRVRTVISTLGA